MSTSASALSDLGRERPEWRPWLDIVAEVQRASAQPTWDDAVPDAPPGDAEGVPRLAGAALSVPAREVERLLDRLVHTATRGGTPELATLARARDRRRDPLALFAASLRQDAEQIDAEAAARGMEPGAWQAIVALLPVPFLQACNRRWAASLPRDWIQPFCPVCGAWPAFAEIRGIERSRHYRCGRCGGEWHAHGLSCPFCRTTDHHELEMLVSDTPGAPGVVEACRRCRGYVKSFNRLQGCPRSAVMLEDLAAVALDLAALEHGYARPRGAGYPVHVTICDASIRRSFLGHA